MPFALRACQRLPACPISGSYNLDTQKWEGASLRFAATRTVTATYVGQDSDLD